VESRVHRRNDWSLFLPTSILSCVWAHNPQVRGSNSGKFNLKDPENWSSSSGIIEGKERFYFKLKFIEYDQYDPYCIHFDVFVIISVGKKVASQM
jgi:hypothetical protein